MRSTRRSGTSPSWESERAALSEAILRRLRKSKLADYRGPDTSLWCFIPDWVGPLWRAREWKGSISLLGLLRLPDTPAMHEFVYGLMNALTSAENEAQETFAKDK